MSDICKCANFKCTLRSTCFRYRAESHPYWQSFAGFIQDSEGHCQYHMNVKDWEEMKMLSTESLDKMNKRSFEYV